MAWHVDMTWHNLSGLIQSLTLPGHYWITLTIHAFKLALGQAPIIAPVPTAPARRVLHGLYAVWCLAPALSRNARIAYATKRDLISIIVRSIFVSATHRSFALQ